MAPDQAPSDAGTRVRDMISILQKKAPRLCPNIVPKAFKQTDLLSICATAEQKEAVKAVLHEHKKEQGQKLVLLSSVDMDAGVFRIHTAQFVSEVEADVYSVDRILALFLKGDNDELTVRLQHFLSVNGHEESDVSTAQEVYNLAYATSVCLSNAPLRPMLGNTPLPLEASMDAGALVSGLFKPTSAAAGKGKRKKGSEGGNKGKAKSPN